ncbi:MAG: tetratricopeptide repeat protein [Bacillota bacterium]
MIMNKNNAHYKKAMDSIKDNNVSAAIDELKLCLKFNSNSTSVLNLLGLAYYLKCRFDKAEKTWRKSLSLAADNNKARDYLELITKRDFKELRKEYKQILFDDKTKQNKKIKFLKKLIEKHGELIEPYVILGLLYKREGDYEQALKYFYQAYDLDSGNKNIKNYIKQCEKEDKTSPAFNFKSKTNKKSAVIAGIIAIFIFMIFLNLSGLNPGQLFENEFQTTDKEQASNSEESKLEKTEKQSNSEAKEAKKVDDSKLKKNKLEFKANLNLMKYQKEENFLTLEDIKKLTQKEKTKEELISANNYLETKTEQQLFNLALDYFSRSDYQNSSDIFNSIYNLSETDYLKRESLFLLARSYEKMEAYQSAEHFYRIYLNEYPESNYYDEALYNLGLMLEEAGLEKKSKEILTRLREEVPYSKYNNSKVYNILNK